MAGAAAAGQTQDPSKGAGEALSEGSGSSSAATAATAAVPEQAATACSWSPPPRRSKRARCAAHPGH